MENNFVKLEIGHSEKSIKDIGVSGPLGKPGRFDVTPKCTIVGSGNNKFEIMRMMAWIEVCGSVGHTCEHFKVNVDGDGKGVVSFQFDDSESQKHYNAIKKDLLEYNINKQRDLKEITIE